VTASFDDQQRLESIGLQRPDIGWGRAILVLLSLAAFEYVPAIFFGRYLRFNRGTWTSFLVRSWYSLFMTYLLLIMTSIIIILRGQLPRPVVSKSFFSEVRYLAYGVGAGVAAGVVTCIFVRKILVAQFFLMSLAAHPFEIETALFLLMIVIALPAAAETVFRGLIQKQVSRRLGSPIAVIITTISFALLAPSFGFWAEAVIGFTNSLLYEGTNRIRDCVIANAVASLIIASYIFASSSK
jgi:membrane protease YdiL (CAAX protease family)